MANLGKTLGGAGQGAMAGAALGSVVPGIGTAVGAVGGGVLGALGSGLDDTEQKAMDQLKANQELYGNINTPNFKTYKPEDYQVAGLYDPTQMTAQTVSEDPSLRNTQLAVLNKMAGLADTGMSAVDNAGYERARELGDQMSRSGEQAAEQNALARGMSGSGTEFAMREAASQAGAGRAMDAGLTQAGDSARSRAMYAQMMGQDAAALRGQDYGVNAGNTGILNRFNEMNTQNQNQAQQYNLGNTQQVANANTSGHNQAQQYNNQMQQQQYQDQLSKASGQSGANTGAAQGYAAQNAANQSNTNSMASLAIQGAGILKGSGGAEVANPTAGVGAKKMAGDGYDPTATYA